MFSKKIDLALASRLEKDLREQGFEFTQPPHTIFCAKKPGVSCTLYSSGSLVVQGKESAEFIEFYLEPEVAPETLTASPLEPHIGMDEAGKGDFFGPLCVAAVYADPTGLRALADWKVRDSKALSDSTVRGMAQKIRALLPYTVIRLFPKKYNELYTKFRNLNRLLGWAHVAALEHLVKKTGCSRAILDQFATPGLVQRELQRKNLAVHLEQRVHGEADPVVAAASILARAAFLEGIDQLSEEMGLTLPKGAGSAIPVMGHKLVAKFGADVLERVAKLHFKTTREILGSE